MTRFVHEVTPQAVVSSTPAGAGGPRELRINDGSGVVAVLRFADDEAFRVFVADLLDHVAPPGVSVDLVVSTGVWRADSVEVGTGG